MIEGTQRNRHLHCRTFVEGRSHGSVTGVGPVWRWPVVSLGDGCFLLCTLLRAVFGVRWFYDGKFHHEFLHVTRDLLACLRGRQRRAAAGEGGRGRGRGQD